MLLARRSLSSWRLCQLSASCRTFIGRFMAAPPERSRPAWSSQDCFSSKDVSSAVALEMASASMVNAAARDAGVVPTGVPTAISFQLLALLKLAIIGDPSHGAFLAFWGENATRRATASSGRKTPGSGATRAVAADPCLPITGIHVPCHSHFLPDAARFNASCSSSARVFLRQQRGRQHFCLLYRDASTAPVIALAPIATNRKAAGKLPDGISRPAKAGWAAIGAEDVHIASCNRQSAQCRSG
mmetsp:Transcript_85412/g.204678  ORF Transcript_85412/g.204678 Transcript_85412/m.204678 type:complete len:243 (-) Transcript_85412:699-1427(-)